MGRKENRPAGYRGVGGMSLFTRSTAFKVFVGSAATSRLNSPGSPLNLEWLKKITNGGRHAGAWAAACRLGRACRRTRGDQGAAAGLRRLWYRGVATPSSGDQR